MLGSDARGRCIARARRSAGRMRRAGGGERAGSWSRAPRRGARRSALPFGVWMALAKATPVAGLDEDRQGLLAANDGSQLPSSPRRRE